MTIPLRTRLLFVWDAIRIAVAEAFYTYRVSRCGHIGAREWTTYAYHETMGAPALECAACGLYWDATQGHCPGAESRSVALRRAWRALAFDNPFRLPPGLPAGDDWIF
jgi:hypothetical protein